LRRSVAHRTSFGRSFRGRSSRGRSSLVAGHKEVEMQRYRELFRLGTLLFTGIVAGVVTLAAQTPPSSAPAPAKPQTKMAKPATAGQPATAGHHDKNADAIKWEPAPPSLPAGATAAILAGNPTEAGELCIIRVKGPNGYRIMPHTHPTDEHVTVLKGTLLFGMGEKWDDAAMKAIPTGGYGATPKETAHYVQFRGETIVEVVGIGPLTIKYINPDDDPSLKKAPTTSNK
jgi:quercetin dioxygenase-like cupin family protein